MKDLYYYIRDAKTTVCLLVDEWTGVPIARGVAVCSEKERFTKKDGRIKSLGRANQAIINSRNTDEIHKSLKKKHGLLGVTQITHFACYEPELTEFEKNITKFALPKKEAK